MATHPRVGRLWEGGDAARAIPRRAILLAAMIATLAVVAHAQPEQPRTRILIVYTNDPNAPGVVRFSQQLKAVVRARFPTGLEFYEEFLDLDRFSDPARRPGLARDLAAKYERLKPDAIVTEGSNALRFAVDHLADVFPAVPIVYGAAFVPIVDYSSLPATVVGRRQPLPFASTYALALAVQPDAKRVVVVAGASPTDSLLAAEARRQITPLLNGMVLSVYEDWSYEGLVDSLRRFSSRTFVIFSSFTRDKRGRTFTPGELIAPLTHAASVPVYGIAANWVGDGIVGGAVMDFSEDGRRVGKIVLQVLARTPNEPMPASELAATPFLVDWRQLGRWGLSENRLPPHTQVVFRPQSMWERYRGALVAAVGLFMIESLLLVFLLVERKRRLRAQRAVGEARRQVEHLSRIATVSGLAAGVSHQLRQPLTAIRANAEAGAILLAQTPPDTDEVQRALEEIVRENARATDVIDRFRLNLRKHDRITATVDVNTVCRDIAKLVEHEVSRSQARLVLRLDPDTPSVRGDPLQLQQALLNLTLNALDAVTESPADRETTISTTRSNGDVEVRVSDTGPGFPPEVRHRLFEPFFTTKVRGLGMGLTIVRSIVEQHNGVLRAENGVAGGALFTVTLPAENESAGSPPNAHKLGTSQKEVPASARNSLGNRALQMGLGRVELPTSRLSG